VPRDEVRRVPRQPLHVEIADPEHGTAIDRDIDVDGVRAGVDARFAGRELCRRNALPASVATTSDFALVQTDWRNGAPADNGHSRRTRAMASRPSSSVAAAPVTSRRA